MYVHRFSAMSPKAMQYSYRLFGKYSLKKLTNQYRHKPKKKKNAVATSKLHISNLLKPTKRLLVLMHVRRV